MCDGRRADCAPRGVLEAVWLSFVPADGALPTEAVALTSTTISFGAPVPAQSNAQVDIPLAREPDEAEPTRHLHIKATTSPLYLLNSVLLL